VEFDPKSTQGADHNPPNEIRGHKKHLEANPSQIGGRNIVTENEEEKRVKRWRAADPVGGKDFEEIRNGNVISKRRKTPRP